MRVKKHPLEDASIFKFCAVLIRTNENKSYITAIAESLGYTVEATLRLGKRVVNAGLVPKPHKMGMNNKTMYTFDYEYFWSYFYKEIGARQDKHYDFFTMTDLRLIIGTAKHPARIETFIDTIKQLMVSELLNYKKAPVSPVFDKFEKFLETEMPDQNYYNYTNIIKNKIIK